MLNYLQFHLITENACWINMFKHSDEVLYFNFIHDTDEGDVVCDNI